MTTKLLTKKICIDHSFIGDDLYNYINSYLVDNFNNTIVSGFYIENILKYRINNDIKITSEGCIVETELEVQTFKPLVNDVYHIIILKVSPLGSYGKLTHLSPNIALFFLTNNSFKENDKIKVKVSGVKCEKKFIIICEEV